MMSQKIKLAYIAGIIDGEGYIGIKKDKIYARQNRKTPGYHARIQIRMVNEEAIRLLAENLGGSYYKERPSCAKGKPLFCYQASDAAAENILSRVVGLLVIKKRSAQVVLELRKVQRSGTKHRTKVTGLRRFPNRYGAERMVPSKAFSDQYVKRCESLYLKCKALNKVGAQSS